MNLGIYLDLRNPPQWRQEWSRLYGFALDVCQEADQLGAHSIWLSEHHLFDDGYLPQPLTFAAAVAARTRRVRIGTAVLIAPFRPAIQIAEEAAIIDALSCGRLDLGLGAGYRQPEFDAFGADLRKRYTTTDERVRTLRKLWSAGQLLPPPTQEHLPIWLGYNGPKGARRAGVLGEGLLSIRPELYAPYRQGLIDGGHDPASGRMAGTVNAFVTDDPEGDWPEVAKHHAYQWDSYFDHMARDTDRVRRRPIDATRSREAGIRGGLSSLVYGTPPEVAHSISTYICEVPVETVFIWASIGGMREEMTMRHVQAICTRLAPLMTAFKAD